MNMKDLRWILFFYEWHAIVTNKSKVCKDMIRIASDMIWNGEY